MEEKNREEQNQIPAVIRLDRQLKYTGTILKIYEDTVIANGHEAHWDFIHHDGAAAVVAVDDEGYLLMVRQYRNALNRETLEIPAGILVSMIGIPYFIYLMMILDRRSHNARSTQSVCRI